MKKQKMLLHVCCANCSIYPLQILGKDFDVFMYYYNPNIQPEDEYMKRLEYVKKISEIYNVPLITGEYEVKKWLESTETLKSEPEGGKRCQVCFEIRLAETAKKASEMKFDIFGTTLTISPHKNQEVINKIGKDLASKIELNFYRADFKKNDGFKNTMAMSKKLDIYRQNYCGCIYSFRKTS
ncbi:MAG: epoxyqueuosine reductase QueH [Actinobacteria bacterium]|nr:epoxyqueuosine reductase QueH [Actinomycetota bacterium]